ncbi:MAG: hypothetical protein M1168_00685 [Candidatus Marsarchaeota archaeon]|nr:hypothetical protein [Candidatus Marsarchaeota archaeon]MCL5094487.1 hypothetical protein [Candidatus Marsarchaeota archaeon]
MAKTKNKDNAVKNNKNAVFLVKATKHGGFDYLHISLIALVIILIALVFAFAKLKPVNTCYSLNSTSSYGILNNTCVKLENNNTQVLNAVEKILAGYAKVNSTFSLLPYYSYINKTKIYYLENQDAYFVEVPFKDPFVSNQILNFSLLLNGSNLTLINAFTQSLIKPQNTTNKVVSFGVVKLAGKVSCASSNTIPVYIFNDPYSPGAFESLFRSVNISKNNSGINMSYYFIFGSSSINFYNSYGVHRTQLLGQYLACTSQQPKFYGFLYNLSKIFSGTPMSNYTLYQTAYGSGLNITQLNACLSNSTTLLTKESDLAKFYNVVSVPQFIINCEYTSLPQTLINAVNYSRQQK